MKLDTAIIPVDQPALVAEVGQRRLGKYRVIGTWGPKVALSATDFKTTFAPRTAEDERIWQAYVANVAARQGTGPFLENGPLPPESPVSWDRTVAEHGDWGERDSLANVPRGPGASIKLAIDPTLAQEGDE